MKNKDTGPVTIQTLIQDVANLSTAINAVQSANDAATQAEASASIADATAVTANGLAATANATMIALQQQLDADVAAYEAAYEAAQVPTAN